MELSLNNLEIGNNLSCLQINMNALEGPSVNVPAPSVNVPVPPPPLPLGQEEDMGYTEPIVQTTVAPWSVRGYRGFSGYQGVTGCAGVTGYQGVTGVKGSGATGISRRITPMQRAVSENILETSDGLIIKTRVGKMIRPQPRGGQSITA